MMMLALTYQQDPKRPNNTVRLKRISQRFSPGFKHIRLLKEDYLGRFTSKFPYKKNVQLTKLPVSFRVPHIKPYKKWRSMIPRSTKKMALTPHYRSGLDFFDNMTQRFVASHRQIGSSNEGSSFSRLILRDARQKPKIKKTANLSDFRLFTACFQQFHMPYNYVRSQLTGVLIGRRASYIHEMRQKETSFKRQMDHLVWEVSKIRKVLKNLPNKLKFAKDRSRCFKDINARKREFAKLRSRYRYFLRRFRYRNNSDAFATQVPLFNFGSLKTKVGFPHKLTRFPQNHMTLYRGFGPALPKIDDNFVKFKENRLRALPFPKSSVNKYLSLRKGKQSFIKMMAARKLNGYGSSTTFFPNNLFEKVFQNEKRILSPFFYSKNSSIYTGMRKRAHVKRTAFNMFNFNSRSNQVLFRYMENLKRKFGVYYYDIPFRIDNYRKAYQKVRRPSKFKQMCIARNKIRLFYGQLTVKKMGRVLRKAPPSFPFMFGLMERRLDVLLVRSNFCKNIFTAQYIVRSGKVLVNNRVYRNCFYAVKCYDFVTFKSKEFEMFCKYIILTKLRLNKLKYNFVPYLIVNYKLMYLYVRPIINARRHVGFTAPMVHSYLSRF